MARTHTLKHGHHHRKDRQLQRLSAQFLGGGRAGAGEGQRGGVNGGRSLGRGVCVQGEGGEERVQGAGKGCAPPPHTHTHTCTSGGSTRRRRSRSSNCVQKLDRSFRKATWAERMSREAGRDIKGT